MAIFQRKTFQNKILPRCKQRRNLKESVRKYTSGHCLTKNNRYLCIKNEKCFPHELQDFFLITRYNEIQILLQSSFDSSQAYVC